MGDDNNDDVVYDINITIEVIEQALIEEEPERVQAIYCSFMMLSPIYGTLMNVILISCYMLATRLKRFRLTRFPTLQAVADAVVTLIVIPKLASYVFEDADQAMNAAFLFTTETATNA